MDVTITGSAENEFQIQNFDTCFIICTANNLSLNIATSHYTSMCRYTCVVYRKWDRPRYSDTLVSRDVWINSYEEKGDSLKVAKIDTSGMVQIRQ